MILCGGEIVLVGFVVWLVSKVLGVESGDHERGGGWYVGELEEPSGERPPDSDVVDLSGGKD